MNRQLANHPQSIFSMPNKSTQFEPAGSEGVADSTTPDQSSRRKPRKRGRRESPIVVDGDDGDGDDGREIMQENLRARKKRKMPHREVGSESNRLADRGHIRSGSDLTIVQSSDDAYETDFSDFGGPELNFHPSYARIGEPAYVHTSPLPTVSAPKTYASVVAGPSEQTLEAPRKATAALRSTREDDGPTELQTDQLSHAHICAMRQAVNEQWQEIHRLSDQVDAQRNEKYGIQAELEKERRQYTEKNQDAIFRLMSQKEKYEKEMESLTKQIVSLKRFAAELNLRAAEKAKELLEKKQVEIEKLKQVAEENANLINEKTHKIFALEHDIAQLARRLDRAETWNRLRDGDIEELRRMYLEDTARIDRQKQGLPPAYGSLDQEDPPWNQHVDGGQFATSAWENLVRAQFQNRMRATYDKMKGNEEGKSPITILFCDGFLAIKETCVQLRELLKIGEASQNSKRRKNSANSKNAFGRIVASLVFEMAGEISSSYQIAGGDLDVSQPEKAKLALCYQEMDEVLLTALGYIFSGGKHDVPLRYRGYSFQRYLSATETLRDNLEYRQGIGSKMFAQSQEWLNDQIEVTRVLAARAADEVAT